MTIGLPRTLRARFAAWTALLVLAVTAVFGGFVYARTAAGLRDALDDALVLDESQVISELDVVDGRLVVNDGLVDPPAGIDLRDQGFTIRILDGAGQPLQELGPYAGLPLPANLSGPSFMSVDHEGTGHTVRVRTAPVLSGDKRVAVVQVVQSLEETESTLARLRLTMILGAPAVAAAAAAGGWLLARRALAPIDRMTRTAARISADDLSARLELPDTQDEVGRLATTFDGMLARLDAAFERERRLTADASHELRTPLTAMQAILSVTGERPRSPDEYAAALADLEVQADRLRAVTEGLMRLARADRAGVDRRAAADVSELVADVVESMRVAAEEKGLDVATAIEPGLEVSGDADALVGLFANLIDNAIKYMAAGSLGIAVRREGGQALTEISDSGPGIPPAERSRVFDRFYRGSGARGTPGAGLGLAIARAVAAAHGGTITAAERAGGGSTFTVTLPLLRE